MCDVGEEKVYVFVSGAEGTGGMGGGGGDVQRQSKFIQV